MQSIAEPSGQAEALIGGNLLDTPAGATGDTSNPPAAAAHFESLGVGLQAPGIKAGMAGRARKIFSKPITAAVATFVVTIATALMLSAAPAEGALIVAGWLVISVGLILLTRFGGRDPDADA